jgi:hypothetical protein
MTFDGSTIRLYRDGVLAGSRAGAGSIIASTGALRLGGNNIWGEWFAGRIDDVRIYNRALSVSEIASDMNTPVGGPPPPDTTAPVASVTAPANNALVRGAVSVTATASDNVGVTSVQFLLDGNALGAPDTTSPYSVSWDTTLASNATHTLAVRAVDAAGNPGTSASLNVIVDNLPPAVAISSPAGGTTVSGTVTVSATATDLNGIANVQFRLDGANLGSPDTTSPYSVSWNTVSSTNGSHTLSAIGADSAGNQTTAQNVMVTVSNIVDTTPPSVSVTSPAIGATVSGTVTVTAGASDTSGITSVQFLLDGNPLGAADTTAPYSASWNTTQSTNGSHTLSARATDGVGLTATSSGVGITVNNAWTVPSGLVAAYTFSEGSLATTADASGAGLNGTITGATWTTSGRFGNALSFNGLSDWVTVADSPALRFTSGMTIEAWVYPTAIGGGAWRTVVMKEAAGDLSYTLYADDSTPSRPAGYINRGGTHVSVTGTAPLPLNTWSHIAVTYGGGNLRFFLNGTQLATRAQTGNISTSTNPLRIGGNSPWGEFFTGRIDEVRLYNRALTAAEIAAGMNQTVGAP